jgi:hypothetical protein
MMRITWRAGLCGALLTALGGATVNAQPARVAGVTCSSQPAFRCPDGDCPRELIAQAGNARLPKSRRDFFLDYPCDLKPGERVTFVLSLHGGGMNANWHRHYFPLVDLKDKYRLVVATPTATKVLWTAENDDAHLRSIVTFVYDTFGANIAAFWLVGHSHGGATADRISRDPFYRNRLTGLVSLSGGRFGSNRAYAPEGSESAYLLPTSPRAPHSRAAAQPSREPRVGLTDAADLPDAAFSYIYSSGEYELTAAGLPDHSKWAQRLGCQAQSRLPDVVDRKAGYVWDARAPLSRTTWGGRKPGPGRAQLFAYPGCPAGRIVADVIRLGKGHTEGLEPNVTEAIVRLMVSARSETK